MIKSLTTRKGNVVYYDDETKEIITLPSITCYLMCRNLVKNLKAGLENGNITRSSKEST